MKEKKEKRKFVVTCTRIYNGYINVEAKSKEEAIEIARGRMSDVEWQFGEETVDYAEVQ